jgi:shikimate kinase
MRMSRSEFLAWPHKAITLLGMSGVGKTTLAYKLPSSKWFHYSGDYRIGTKYLAEPILDNIKRQAMRVDFLRDLLRNDSIYIASNITFHNLQPVSTFLGKIGRTDLGGLPVNEFKRRQRLHREAEINAMRDVAEFIVKAQEIYGYDHFINDAGGSLVELDDQQTEKTLAENTLILYLKADEEMERELVRRAVSDPKPLYYNEKFLDQKLADYVAEAELESPDRIVPDEFVRWIFPSLVAHRRPKYEALAKRHGYTLNARLAEGITNERDFLDLVSSALD